MKRTFLLSLSILFATLTFSQTNATNFTVNDCSGVSHDLFTELDEGKVVVIAWVMPCGSCIGPSLEAFQVAQSYSTSNPGQVLYYLADDYANTPCSSLASWANGTGMGGADAFFSNSAVSMSNYGQPGMPKVIVVGCSEHKVYFNKNYTSAGIGIAIDQALLECNAINTAVNEQQIGHFNLHLFPNPARNLVTVSYEMTESSSVNLDVLNITGQTVLAISKSIQDAGSVEFQVNTTSLSDGLYFLRIQTEKGSQVVKFSVTR